MLRIPYRVGSTNSAHSVKPMTNTDQPYKPLPPTRQDPAAAAVYPPGYAEPEDEIDLLNLLLVLLKHKMLIIGTVGFAAVAAVVISLVLPNIYRSTATIIPHTETVTTQAPASLSSALGGLSGLTGGILGLGADTDLTKLQVILRSRELTHRVITKYELMPVFFPDDWDPDKKAWNTDEPPTEQDAFALILEDLLSVFEDIKRGTLNVAFDHPDPEFAKTMVDRYLTELSEAMRAASIHDAREKTAFVREELNRTADALLREKLYTLLASEIAKETFARAQKYFGFRVIDPPIVPDPDKKLKPKRTLICVLSVIVAFFLSVFAAFLLESVQKATKNAVPEQRAALLQHLPFLGREGKS